MTHTLTPTKPKHTSTLSRAERRAQLSAEVHTAAQYGLLALLTGLLLLAGGSKLFASAGTMAMMDRLNFAPGEIFLIGLLEITLAGLLWVRRTRVIALGALVTLLAGAAGAHLAAGESLATTTPMWVFGIIAVATMAVVRGDKFRDFLFD